MKISILALFMLLATPLFAGHPCDDKARDAMVSASSATVSQALEDKLVKKVHVANEADAERLPLLKDRVGLVVSSSFPLPDYWFLEAMATGAEGDRDLHFCYGWGCCNGAPHWHDIKGQGPTKSAAMRQMRADGEAMCEHYGKLKRVVTTKCEIHDSLYIVR